MKKIYLISILLLTNIGLNWAQQETKEINTSQTKDSANVVINQKMIDKFNAYEYPADAVTLNSLLSSYPFNDLKVISQAYQYDELMLENKNVLNEKLAEIKENLKHQDIQDPSIHNYLSEVIIP